MPANIQDLTNEIVNSLVTDITTTLKAQIEKQVAHDVAQKMAQVDVQQMLREYVDRTLGNAIKTINFPSASIPGPAIDLETFVISGRNIKGGVIQHFGSTGIQDQATQCQLTVLDDATVVENNLIAASANVKGDLTVEGSLNVTGDIDPDSVFFKDLSERAAGLVRLSLNKDLFSSFSDLVFEKIKADGIDLSKITLNSNSLIKGNALGTFVTESNIQKLGELKTLDVIGESTLGSTLYVRNKRVGINTDEPAEVLDIWDQEVNVCAKKLRKNVGLFGTLRNQQLVLSANSKENLFLNVDGSVSIPKLTVAEVDITSSPVAPTHDAKPGTVVLNSAPELGKPASWVSLGGARWAATSNLS